MSSEATNITPRSKRPTRTIEIKLEVPEFETAIKASQKSAKVAKLAWSKRHFRIILASALLLITAALTVNILVKRQSSSASNQETGKSIVSEAEKKAQTPQFSTVLPAGKTIESLGGWTRVSPSDRNAVFAYSDEIRNNRIIVSEQPLPDSFKEDTDAQVEGLAADYKATEKISAAGLTVYIGTSAKGPQSVILTKNGLLILLKSSVKLSNDDWIQYVNSLQ